MYQVGQVLFIILNKKQQVIPVQVTEQVVRRSLNGEEISYSVSIPSRDENRVHELESIDGEVFDSIEDVRQYMLEQTQHIISTITERALKVAKNRFDYDGPIIPDMGPSLPSVSEKEETFAKVDLGDGTMANVKLPDIPDLVK
jgi:hypothetical protein